jgi:hypothetical protein
MKHLLLWFMGTRIYSFFSLKIIPYLYVWFMPRKPADGIGEWLLRIEDGDILLCHSKTKLTSFLIPGKWDHAAIATPQGVVEMVGTGWRCIPYIQYWNEASSFCVMSFRNADPEYQKAFYEKALSFKGTPYDIHFTLGVKALYCSELIHVCDTENRGEYNLADLAGLGRPYLSPQGIYNAKGLHVVYESHH